MWLWRVTKLIASFIAPAVWLALGFYIGHSAGYGRGARDLANLVLELRTADVDEPPPPWTKGAL